MSLFDQGIIDILEQAVDSKLDNFEMQVHEGNEKGAGFLGEMTFISLINKKTHKVNNLVIKVVRPSESDNGRDLMSSSYLNEIHYYTVIFPALLDFQKSYLDVRTFDNFPKCYATCSDKGFEKLVLENLKFKNYELHPKNVPLDLKSFETLFKLYGEYHALSFAFKQHQPEDFLKVTKDLTNNWLKMNKNLDTFTDYLNHFFEKIERYLEEEGEEEILKKFKKYIDDPLKIYNEAATYDGLYGAIIHGDCWSNNLMIKYNTSREIDHLKMIDFQMGMVGSPTHDLNYSFYSGAGKESLDNLENLLKLYHNTLSVTLQKYGCDPEKIYPYEVLKKEWKKHCRFGIIMGIMLWVTKLATDISEMATINEMLDKTVEVSGSNDYGIKYNEKEYRKFILDLLRHAHENDFL